MKPSFCAHCIEDRDDLAQRRIGNRVVWVCGGCRNGGIMYELAMDSDPGSAPAKLKAPISMQSAQDAATAAEASGARFHGHSFAVSSLLSPRDRYRHG